MIERGQGFMSLLYTYRSCSKAIPQVKSEEQGNKNEQYQATFNVLEPQITKLKNLAAFSNECINFVAAEFQRLLGEEADAGAKKKKKKDRTLSVPDSLVRQFVLLLDLLSKMDALKNMKGCNNDLSFYKRAYAFLRKNLEAAGGADQAIDNQEMYMFLASQNVIVNTLKMQLTAVDGYTDMLVELLEHCRSRWSTNQYMHPEEKHALLRVVPLCLFLYDAAGSEENNAFRTKDFNITEFAEMLRRYPVLPLFGDMAMVPFTFIRACPNYEANAAKWPADTNAELAKAEYCLVNKLEQYRTLHDEFIADFSQRVTEVRRVLRADKLVSQKASRQMYTMVLRGFRLLSNMTASVLEQSAWKFNNPSKTFPPDREVHDIVEYEKVVRYNYDSDERYALVEVIALIKGLSTVLLRAESLLVEMIRRRIHDEMQQFVQMSLREMLREAVKKKKAIRAPLLQIREMAADWLNGVEPDDPAVQGKKETKKDSFKVQIPTRCAGPSTTQLELMRCILNSVYNSKDKNIIKELNAAQVSEMKQFYERAFFYQYVLNYQGTVRRATDLSMLWYREFYLELAKADQFPIEMSLPWLLADHILQTYDSNPAMVEFVLFPLDLYNDAANIALRVLRQQFMYNEIEAEVNLVFDQLVYKLSEIYFTHVKVQASSRLLDQDYRNAIAGRLPAGKLSIPRSRFEVLLRQRHVQLLGRSIDLSSLVSQRMNYALRENLDYAIAKFESSSLASVLELQETIRNIKEMHRIMSLQIQLDPFATMLHDTSDSQSLVSLHGRIILHAVYEVVNDLIPNWNFNTVSERFIAGSQRFGEPHERAPAPKIPMTHQWGAKALNAAYSAALKRSSGFVGLLHWTALFELVGIERMGLLVDEILSHIDKAIGTRAAPYIKTLLDGMPENTKLPSFRYGTAGAYAFYDAKLEPIINYDNIPQVLQVFREIGNSLVILRMFDTLLHETATMQFIQLAPFVGYTPTTREVNPDALSSVLQRLASSNSPLLSNPATLADAPSDAAAAVRMYLFKQTSGSLMRHALHHLHETIAPHRNAWMGPPPENGVLAMDSCFEYYRLWSAFMYIFCMPPSRLLRVPPPETYGDGFIWGGMALVHLMGQTDKFAAFDFGLHILNVEDAQATKSTEPACSAFLATATYARTIIDVAVATYKAFLPFVDTQAKVLNPPADDTASLK